MQLGERAPKGACSFWQRAPVNNMARQERSASPRMAVPHSIDARLFYRCAMIRMEDAAILYRADRNAGAVYMAGYGVECMLNALILSAVAEAIRSEVMKSFRGARAHDFDWLRGVYYSYGGARFPGTINRHYTVASNWSTDLRYSPRTLSAKEREQFLSAAEAILAWADGWL